MTSKEIEGKMLSLIDSKVKECKHKLDYFIECKGEFGYGKEYRGYGLYVQVMYSNKYNAYKISIIYAVLLLTTQTTFDANKIPTIIDSLLDKVIVKPINPLERGIHTSKTILNYVSTICRR